MNRWKRFFKPIAKETDQACRSGKPKSIQTAEGPLELKKWQQALGNQRFGHLLSQTEAFKRRFNHTARSEPPSNVSDSSHSSHADTTQMPMSAGRPLDSHVRNRMQSAFGHDFSDVSIHTDSQAARVTGRHRAEALTLGNQVAFSEGAYRPGSIFGDALIAHELAHVVQQRQAVGEKAISREIDPPKAGDPAQERDANRSAVGAIASLWHGVKNVTGGMTRRIRPSLQTGMRLQLVACKSSRYQNIEIPEFLGPHSQETLRTINRRLEAADLLEDMLIVGPLIVVFTTPPHETAAGGGYPLEEQARAIAAVPTIVRSRILQDIDLLLVMHGNDLTAEETAYWQHIRSRFSQ